MTLTSRTESIEGFVTCAKACLKYGVWQEKSMYGRKVVGIIRSTFVIGPDGTVETVFSPVRVKGHAAAVAQAIAAT